MTWRRKPDGRPFADVSVAGKRRRVSLLPADLIESGDIAPPDAVCEQLYHAFLRSTLPLLERRARDTQPTLPTPGNPTLAELAQWYTNTIQTVRGDADSTKRNNQVLLDRFVNHVHDVHCVHTVHNLQTTHVDAYTAWRMQSAEASTVRKELSVIRAMLRAAKQRRLYTGDLPEFDMPDRRDPDIEEPVRPEHIMAILERLRAGCRDFAISPGGQSPAYNIVRFLVFTGCRPSDACNLTRDRVFDLHTPYPTAHIRQQKTRRWVAIALAPEAAEAVKQSLVEATDRHFSPPSVTQGPASSEALSTTRERTVPHSNSFEGAPATPQGPAAPHTSHFPNHVFISSYTGRPFTPSAIFQLLKRQCDLLGIPQITPKSFRQSLVSTLYDAGADHALVQSITGHRSDQIHAYRKLRRNAPHDLARLYQETIQGTQGTPGTDPT